MLPVSLLLAACDGGPEDPRPIEVALEEGGIVACPDPGLRSASRFDRKQAEAQPLDELPGQREWLHGGGIAVEDLDDDGLMDVFLPGEGPPQLRWGTGGGFFEEGAASAFAGIDLGYAVGATPVDYDADGDLDLLVTRWERSNVMLRNEGGRRFTDVSSSSGLPRFADRHQTASWADIDRDGDLDLFVGTYGEYARIDVLEGEPDCSDHIAEPAQLWRNEGGWFIDISDALPPEVHEGYTFASGFYDIDEDGYPELFLSHDDGLCASSLLVDNIDGRTFAIDASAGFHPASHDMGMAVGDLDGDAVPDFALTSWKVVSLLTSSENPDAANGVRWIDSTIAYGLSLDVDRQVYGWGAEFGDLDNDADLDLAMGFGYWAAYQGGGDPPRQPDGLWIQDGGQLSDRGREFGVADEGPTRGLVLADLNGDGWLDIVKRVLGGPTPMYLSRCGEESWLQIRLRQGGWNTRGVGARIRVTAGGRQQVRWIGSGSTGMYSGAPLEAHFGLGSAETVDAIEVLWPDGEVSTTRGVGARQQITLRRK